jgi:uncharacterized protein with HEPN domain
MFKRARKLYLHEYFGVDTEILWQTIQEDLPLLKRLPCGRRMIPRQS